MPPENDPARLMLLYRLLSDPASNVVLLRPRALNGSDEPNDLGLNRLMPASVTPYGKKLALKDALASFIKDGGKPNRVDYMYEDHDPETVYEFRLTFQDVRIYVKTEFLEDEPSDPVLIIRSVKRQD